MKEHSVKDLSERLTAIFHRIEGVESAYLFGSFALQRKVFAGR